jgi:hypothetical protein
MALTWGLPTQGDPARPGGMMVTTMAMMSVMIILNGPGMLTTGLNSNDNKTESICGLNKKSNHDSDNNYAADNDETSKNHPIEIIFEIDRTHHCPVESTRIASTGL